MGKAPQRDSIAMVVFDHRVRLGLSVRELARRAGVSAAYISAIESGRSSTTGRPPVISLDVATGLAAALELDVLELVNAGRQAPISNSSGHVLLFALDGATPDVMSVLNDRYGDLVDHWLHIADPRGPVSSFARQTVVVWPFGHNPYDSTVLDPDQLLKAVEEVVVAHAPQLRGKRVGMAITDCSAVMRFVANASTEVELESRWHQEVQRIWRTHLDAEPAMDVCGYFQKDLLALGLTIDQLSTILDLIRWHDEVVSLAPDGHVIAGPASVRRLLADVRPMGVSETSWDMLVSAAADGLTRA